MLEELRIRGLGVIDDATLALAPGLTAVTGETGAGKTMVVTGLLLMFGGRGDSARVRSGSEQATVDGRVELPPGAPAVDRVRAAGGALDDGTGLVLRRIVTAAGRSRAYVGGAPAPVAVLADLAEDLIAVHGQSDQIRLTRPAQQRAALDRYAGTDLGPFTVAYEHWSAASARLSERTGRLSELRREHDLLAYGLAEIEAADPQPKEAAELAAEASRLAHADALRLAARGAHDAILGDAEDPTSDTANVSSLLGSSLRSLGQQAGDDPTLDQLAARLGELSSLVGDLAAEFGGYVDSLDADPARLAAIEGRRSVLAALIRKYAEPVDGQDATDAVLAWADSARARLEDLDVSDAAIAALTTERDRAAQAAADQAALVSALRRSAASRLGRAVTDELAGLALTQATVSIEVRPRPAVTGVPSLTIDGSPVGVGPDGCDEVEFGFRSHPDAPALPLARGASGGELSRVMLALEVCLVGADPLPIMIFDEVDAGIGGRAATEVGRRLARLARERQVIVVTHLAQVAAYADRHIVVDRSGDRAVSSSDVRVVDAEDRVVELARMLAGTDSAPARQHADELLATAEADRTSIESAEHGRGERAGKGRRPAKTGPKAAKTGP